jgi:ABC-type Fe3+/spermidine/putrescine transport system ATPase subunit
VNEVLQLVGLADFAKRSVTELSGGEQQRVALARSLAPRPRLLMLDEPLGSLDADLRERLVIDLREIIKAAGVTAIYVTHDQQEAFVVADRVAVMNAGKIQQIDAPDALYLRPQTRVVANFLGLRNIMDGHQAKALLGDVEIDAAYILLHPAFLEWPGDDFRAQVERCVFRGHFVQLTLRHDSGQSIAMQIPASGPLPNVGDVLEIGIRAGGVVPLRDG